LLEGTAEPVYLVITGQGPEMENLRREIAELGIGERVRIYRTERDRFDVIRSYDIFVLSSLQEGLSNALVEALAKALAEFVNDPERRRIVGQTAVVHARHEFSMERMVEEHHHAYRLLVNGKLT